MGISPVKTSTSVPVLSASLPTGKSNNQANISPLPDDGNFQSQIDSDQETVTFDETSEKNDDLNKTKTNSNSQKKEHEKKTDLIEKREINTKTNDKDKNKRKKSSSDNDEDKKRWKRDDK